MPNYRKNILDALNSKFRELRGSLLYDNVGNIFKGKENIGGSASRFLEGPFGSGEPTPLTTTSPLETIKQPTINIPNPSGLVIPDILQQSSLNTGTIDPSDRSQLAKSGDIDITEAIANRG